MKGKWTYIYSGDLPLRSWWVDVGSKCEYISIVLPEVFGINHSFFKTFYTETSERAMDKNL